MFHTPVNAGYAMSKLEKTFYDVACELSAPEGIMFSFSSYDGETVQSLPDGFSNVIELSSGKLNDPEYYDSKKNDFNDHAIDVALCFDLQVSGVAVTLLRDAGVAKIISYWGSTISGLNSGIKLILKRIEVLFSRRKPDLFIFESEAMRKHAINGRGISVNRPRVIPTGVDTDLLTPRADPNALAGFGISASRRVAIYSGHMEERKGVHVLIEAMKILSDRQAKPQWDLIICGNRPGEEVRFVEMLEDSNAQGAVHFAGYRSDLPQLMRACAIGLIASTGWDSFPMSALEMAACGLPIIVSDLQGLSETVEHGVTGYLFEPGDHYALASLMDELGRNGERRAVMSAAARSRIESSYSVKIQRENLLAAIGELL